MTESYVAKRELILKLSDPFCTVFQYGYQELDGVRGTILIVPQLMWVSTSFGFQLLFVLILVYYFKILLGFKIDLKPLPEPIIFVRML